MSEPPDAATPGATRRARLAVLLGLLLAAWLTLGWFGQRAFLRPLPRHHVEATPAVFGVAFRSVDVPADTEAGQPVVLRTWYVPGPRRETVVLCHGRGDSKSGLLPLVRLVHSLGYTALALEFRAHGESDGAWSTVGAAEQRDLLAALDWLDAHAPAPVAVIGYSMGGCVALHVAARDSRIRGVVTEGAVADLPDLVSYWYGPVARVALAAATPWVRWRTGATPNDARPERIVADIAPRPVLIIHSRADEVVPFSHGQRLFAAAREPKTFWELEAAPHVGGMLVAAAEYRARVSNFLAHAFPTVD